MARDAFGKKIFQKGFGLLFIQELWVLDLGERPRLSTVASQRGLCSLDLELFVFGYLNQNILVDGYWFEFLNLTN